MVTFVCEVIVSDELCREVTWRLLERVFLTFEQAHEKVLSGPEHNLPVPTSLSMMADFDCHFNQIKKHFLTSHGGTHL